MDFSNIDLSILESRVAATPLMAQAISDSLTNDPRWLMNWACEIPYDQLSDASLCFKREEATWLPKDIKGIFEIAVNPSVSVAELSRFGGPLDDDVAVERCLARSIQSFLRQGFQTLQTICVSYPLPSRKIPLLQWRCFLDPTHLPNPFPVFSVTTKPTVIGLPADEPAMTLDEGKFEWVFYIVTSIYVSPIPYVSPSLGINPLLDSPGFEW